MLSNACRAGVANALQPLLEAVGIPCLSLCVQQEAMPSGSHFNTGVTHMISHAFPFIQRFFFWHRAGDYNHIAGRVLPLLNGFRFRASLLLFACCHLKPDFVQLEDAKVYQSPRMFI